MLKKKQEDMIEKKKAMPCKAFLHQLLCETFNKVMKDSKKCHNDILYGVFLGWIEKSTYLFN